MESSSQEVEIAIEALDADGKPQQTDVEVTPDPPKQVKRPAKVTPDDGLAVLQKQLDEERRQTENERQMRIAAEQNAREASESEVRARTEAQTSQLDLVKNAHASLSTAQSTLKARLADAMTAQDFTLAADIQLEMTTNAARIAQLDQAKTNIERAPKPQPRQSVDPIERRVHGMTPQSAAWLRAHPEFARDDAKYRRVVAAHELAVTDGKVEDSPEYFAHIEDTLKIGAPKGESPAPHEDPMRDAARPAPRRAAPPAAPVTRSGQGAGQRTDKVTLSAEEVEMAKLNGQTPEEYAYQKRRIEQDKAAGRLN